MEEEDLTVENILARAFDTAAYASPLAETFVAAEDNWKRDLPITEWRKVEVIVETAFDEGFGAGFLAGYRSALAEPEP